MGTIVGPVLKRILDSWFGTALRKEAAKDADVAYMCEVIDGLLDDCTRFWGETASSLGTQHPVLMAQIRAKLHNLNGLQNHLFLNDRVSLKNTKDEWKELFRAATGGDFDETERPSDANRLTVILQIGWEMKRGVKLRRQSQKRSIFSG